MTDPSLVCIDLEDAEALAQNLREHLQYDSEEDAEFWGSILCRLNAAIRHSQDH
jgi:hypothetical protein